MENVFRKTTGDDIRVTYRVTAGETPIEDLAREICYEQTVEVVEDLARDKWIQENVLGRVEQISPVDDKTYDVTIAYPASVTAYNFPQLLNVLFGNISLKKAIRLVGIEISPQYGGYFPGPRFGVDGVRNILGIHDRPLLATAIKPMGKSIGDLAEYCYQFALGGIDIIKDDHGLSEQPFCPFKDRVMACLEAIDKAIRKTGKKTLYFPCISTAFERLDESVSWAKEAGAHGVLISPMIIGFDFMRHLASSANFQLPIMAHPGLTGVFFANPRHGISHSMLLGTLFRLAGADMVIYPNFGGRFPFTKSDCREIADALRCNLGGLRQAFPVPAGGMDVESVTELHPFYGNDVIFLVGSSLYTRSADLAANVRYFLSLVSGK